MPNCRSFFRTVVHIKAGDLIGFDLWHPSFASPRKARRCRYPTSDTVSLSKSRAVKALMELLIGTMKSRNNGSQELYKLIGGRGSLGLHLLIMH